MLFLQYSSQNSSLHVLYPSQSLSISSIFSIYISVSYLIYYMLLNMYSIPVRLHRVVSQTSNSNQSTLQSLLNNLYTYLKDLLCKLPRAVIYIIPQLYSFICTLISVSIVYRIKLTKYPTGPAISQYIL